MLCIVILYMGAARRSVSQILPRLQWGRSLVLLYSVGYMYTERMSTFSVHPKIEAICSTRALPKLILLRSLRFVKALTGFLAL